MVARRVEAERGDRREAEPEAPERPRKRSKWDDQDASSQVPLQPPPQPAYTGPPPMPTFKVLTIPANQKGALIGRGGMFITAIRQASMSEIKVTHSEGEPMATISISGNVALAERLIAEQLASCQKPRSEVWDVRFVDVPQELVGQTIGSGGSSLREMQERSGCKMAFVPATEMDEAAPPGKQVCRIKGPPDKVAYAEQVLLERVNEVQQIHINKSIGKFMKGGLPGGFGPGAWGGKGAGGKELAIKGMGGKDMGGKGMGGSWDGGWGAGGQGMLALTDEAALVAMGASCGGAGGMDFGGACGNGMDFAGELGPGGLEFGPGGLEFGGGGCGNVEYGPMGVAAKASGRGGRGSHTLVIPCRFALRGHCRNGDACSFSHDPNVLAAAQGNGGLPDEMGPGRGKGYKMVYCRFWDSGKCSRGALCNFAHGIDELRGGLTPENLQIMEEAQQMMMAANEKRMKGQGHGDGSQALPRENVPAAFKTAAFQHRVGGSAGASDGLPLGFPPFA